MRRTTSLVLAALASLSWLAAACTDGSADARPDSHSPQHPATAERPQVTFRAGNDQIELPDEVPSGYVDIRIEALDSGDAHLLIRRLSDDVSFDEYDAARTRTRQCSPTSSATGRCAPVTASC